MHDLFCYSVNECLLVENKETLLFSAFIKFHLISGGNQNHIIFVPNVRPPHIFRTRGINEKLCKGTLCTILCLCVISYTVTFPSIVVYIAQHCQQFI